MHTVCTFAQVFPVDVRPQLFAPDRPAALSLNRDHQLFAELLFQRDRFSQVAERGLAPGDEIFLL